MPEGASILGFSLSLGCNTIYHIQSEEMIQLYTRQLNWIRTHRFDLTGDWHFGEGQPASVTCVQWHLSRSALMRLLNYLPVCTNGD
jgi:hypothetical protein